ncbi:QcrA and Rieske domain-containing protein [Pseudonocardia humida]|uniref:Cytochrome bc1 complex Rieske iron-sulfur subunit n=1 Tax=Pseudonocardia humida TaxID=2800819 RepID=A0ABT1A9V7_9PSEU|nr:Rieske (2Fe-2S) protein [Pseudonocardia humida]MCO1659822.1 Rieske (2Fe-2S) protein [Pseudonocardia humida]
MPPSPSRRHVLLGGAAAGLTACAAPEPVAPPADPPSAAPGAPAAVGSGGTPVAAAADVPVGGALVVERLELVVTQPEAGRFTGLSAVCTHTGCIVNRVEGTSLVCPCHGSRYALDGAVQQGPAPRPLNSRPVSVVEGQIVLQ